MTAPTLEQALRILRERMEARAEGLAPYMKAVVYCPICNLNYDCTASAHVGFHREQHDRVNPPTKLWWELARFTGWTAIPDRLDDIPLIYTPRQTGDSWNPHLVEGRAATWILRHRALLRRAGVGVVHRQGVYLLPEPIWKFICDLAVHLTFEQDAHAIYTEAAARLSSPASYASDGEGAPAQDAGGQAAMPGL